MPLSVIWPALLPLVLSALLIACIFTHTYTRRPPDSCATGCTRLVSYGTDYFIEAEFRVFGFWSTWHPVSHYKHTTQSVRKGRETKKGTAFDTIEDARHAARKYKKELFESRKAHADDGPVAILTNAK